MKEVDIRYAGEQAGSGCVPLVLWNDLYLYRPLDLTQDLVDAMAMQYAGVYWCRVHELPPAGPDLVLAAASAVEAVSGNARVTLGIGPDTVEIASGDVRVDADSVLVGGYRLGPDDFVDGDVEIWFGGVRLPVLWGAKRLRDGGRLSRVFDAEHFGLVSTFSAGVPRRASGDRCVSVEFLAVFSASDDVPDARAVGRVLRVRGEGPDGPVEVVVPRELAGKLYCEAAVLLGESRMWSKLDAFGSGPVVDSAVKKKRGKSAYWRIRDGK
jgi:hypothetical protein